VLAISTDTAETHLAWTRVPRERGGLGWTAIPMLADETKARDGAAELEIV